MISFSSSDVLTFKDETSLSRNARQASSLSMEIGTGHVSPSSESSRICRSTWLLLTTHLPMYSPGHPSFETSSPSGIRVRNETSIKVMQAKGSARSNDDTITGQIGFYVIIICDGVMNKILKMGSTFDSCLTQKESEVGPSVVWGTLTAEAYIEVDILSAELLLRLQAAEWHCAQEHLRCFIRASCISRTVQATRTDPVRACMQLQCKKGDVFSQNSRTVILLHTSRRASFCASQAGPPFPRPH